MRGTSHQHTLLLWQVESDQGIDGLAFAAGFDERPLWKTLYVRNKSSILRGEEIGKGSTAHVFLCEFKGTKCALKLSDNVKSEKEKVGGGCC